jgi:hypothetical protein
VRAWCIALFSALATWPLAPAIAQSVAVTSTTEVDWHGDNQDDEPLDDNYLAGLQKLFATSTLNKWVLGIDLRMSGFALTPASAGDPSALDDRYVDRLEVERAWVGWQGRDAEVVAGDSYVAFGRGLGLTLRKVDDLSVDTSLRGAKVLWRPGLVEATLVAGYTNIANLDRASGRQAEDPRDVIGGGQVMMRVGRVSFGGHAETIAFRRPLSYVPSGTEPPPYVDRWVLAGPIIDAPRLAKSLGFYAEGLVQERAIGRGYGAYGTLTWFRGPLTVLLEGKAYGDLAVVQPRFDDDQSEFGAVRYTTPPTVERLLQPLEHPQQQVRGGRMRADYAITPAMIATAGYGVFRDHVGYLTVVDAGMPPALRPGTIHDPWASLAVAWADGASRATLAGGVRVVIADGSGELVRADKHVEYDVTAAVGRRWQLQVHGTHVQRTKVVPPLFAETFIEGTAQLGAIWTRTLSLTGSWDYTTELLASRVHSPSLSLGYKPTTRAGIEMQVGRMRGGLKCVSGVCREFPPFTGARLAVTLRY